MKRKRINRKINVTINFIYKGYFNDFNFILTDTPNNADKNKKI